MCDSSSVYPHKELLVWNSSSVTPDVGLLIWDSSSGTPHLRLLIWESSSGSFHLGVLIWESSSSENLAHGVVVAQHMHFMIPSAMPCAERSHFTAD
jgi:hypothetical protein